ncbi:LysR family transcriptional regulator [Achromobacter sp. GG226]|uniref:LysR family transcriptional regulator n=1 Tax=Verticiella alkaliphila TaxID=2779529 RepID=UPI001C0AC6B1|nr:LysR family transcriptional regulator [Verticiella sp. GG226]MBU4609407.1 LysR family transcriptional regulator [Verticiella sp. GG226]
MKLAAFAALRAVIRGGTFAAAAAEMHVTPSAISMQMKQLEAFFGQPLFDRSGAHPRPTPLAFQVVQLMGEPLDGLDVLRKESDVRVRGTVRLGIIENLQAVVLPGAVRWLKRHHPGLELQLMRGRTTTLTAALKAGDIEAALVAQATAGATATLHWTPVAKKALVLIAPPSVTR